jgi:hypothetical protein
LEVYHDFRPVPGHVCLSHQLSERIVSSDLSSERSETGASTLGSSLIHKSLEDSENNSHSAINLSFLLFLGELVGVVSSMEVVVMVKF